MSRTHRPGLAGTLDEPNTTDERTRRDELDLDAALEEVAGVAKRPRPGKRQAATRAGKRGVVIYLDPEVARALKVIASRRDISLQALGAEVLEDLATQEGEI